MEKKTKSGHRQLKRRLVIEVSDVRELPHFERRSKGVLSGLGIFEFVSILLAVNETNTRALKITDESLAQRIIAEFPDRASTKKMKEGKMGMWVWRKLYNAGQLTQDVKPKVRSRRYNQYGDVINKFGRVLMRGRSFGKELGIPYLAGFVNGEKYLNGGYLDEAKPAAIPTAAATITGTIAGEATGVANGRQNMEASGAESSPVLRVYPEPAVGQQ